MMVLASSHVSQLYSNEFVHNPIVNILAQIQFVHSGTYAAVCAIVLLHW